MKFQLRDGFFLRRLAQSLILRIWRFNKETRNILC